MSLSFSMLLSIAEALKFTAFSSCFLVILELLCISLRIITLLLVKLSTHFSKLKDLLRVTVNTLKLKRKKAKKIILDEDDKDDPGLFIEALNATKVPCAVLT
ncbi:hypothetical protein EV143_1241 [Flavobacterium chryseum]|nr:hypothetical protein EV143_1241 [Flavobacterium sp. P3160]